MGIKKVPSLLLTDDIALDQRSNAVRLCARMLAEKLKTPIDLVHVEDIYLFSTEAPKYRSLIDRRLRDQKAKLSNLASSIEVPTRSILLNGEPVKKILALSSKKGAYEMIVQGTHGRTGLRRLILGSVAEEVIRQARIPVMTVGPKAQKNAKEFLRNNKLTILIPTGFTGNSNRAEKYGIALAQKIGAKIVLLHSMYETHLSIRMALATPAPLSPIQAVFNDLKAEALKQLKRKAALISKKGLVVTTILNDREISCSEAVLSVSEEQDASFIVMGTHGRSLVSGAFFGKTARDVILGSPVPVVTVHSKNK